LRKECRGVHMHREAQGHTLKCYDTHRRGGTIRAAFGQMRFPMHAGGRGELADLQCVRCVGRL